VVETTVVVAIVLVAACLFLRSFFSTLSGKKSCCDIASKGCGPCSLIDPDSEVEDEGGGSTRERSGGMEES